MSSGNRRTHDSTIPGIVLAAGKGTRMQANQPKAAMQVGGRPMAARVVDAMRGAGVSPIVAVVGHRAEHVQAAIGEGVEYVVQEEQLGTGHATRCAAPSLAGHEGPVVVAYADIPLLTQGDVARLIDHHQRSRAAATMLTAVLPTPGTLGRIVRRSDGSVERIVEARDATQQELSLNEINVGVYCFEAPLLFEILAELRVDNAQSQYYLTDAIGILASRGLRVSAIALEAPLNGIGVNTMDDLARARALSASGGAG